MDLVLTYCLSLIKRFFFLMALGFIVFLLSLSHGFSYIQAAEIYGKFLLIALPFLLWFQQMVITSVKRTRYGFAHAGFIFISSLGCSLFITLFFPVISSVSVPNLRSLPVIQSTPLDTIILNNGVVLLKPAEIIPSPDNMIALISGRTLFFTNITTNQDQITLEGRSTVEFPLGGGAESLKTGNFAQESTFFFLENIISFREYLLKLHTNYKSPPGFTENIPQMLLFYLLLTSIYLWAGFIGLMIGHGQNHLGAMALLFAIGYGFSGKLLRVFSDVIHQISAPFVAEFIILGIPTLGIMTICLSEAVMARRKRL
ncbi:MAG: hypothetical protein ACRC9L_00305 [Brevinema sp.]